MVQYTKFKTSVELTPNERSKYHWVLWGLNDLNEFRVYKEGSEDSPHMAFVKAQEAVTDYFSES